MTIPTEITFRDIDASDALRDRVLERAQRLERFADDIQSLHVTIEYDGEHHNRGRTLKIHAHLVMRGKLIDVRGSSKTKSRKEDPHAMVADTFDALRRKVEDHVRKRRAD